MSEYTTQALVAIVGVLFAYLFLKWLRDPLRKMPGPRGLPLLGNVLSLDPSKMHMILYDWALKYGDVMKISVFKTPMVVINNTEIAYEVLCRTGSDFQGRIESARNNVVLPKDIGLSSIEDPGYPERRRVAVKALKAYGDGVAHLEAIIQDTLADFMEDITKQDGRSLNTQELSSSFFCCVMATILFGERYSSEDKVCRIIHEINKEALVATDPLSFGGLLDLFPFLLKQKIVLRNTQKQIIDAGKLLDDFLYPKIKEAQSTLDKDNMRGVLDHLIAAQSEESSDGPSFIDETSIRGIMGNFVTAGMETSLCVLCQAFLDLLHDPELQKRIQDQIDSRFEPTHVITLNDREKLPELQAYILENFRYETVVPFLVPHMAIRDTELAGYKIPAQTLVTINAFYTSHNPDVYDEPFKVKPERFLDEDRNIVPPGHPARHNSLGFGSGKRVCIGKSLAETRIFLFLAHILQKFSIEPVGELPNRDVKQYNISFLLNPPVVHAKFIRRQ